MHLMEVVLERIFPLQVWTLNAECRQIIKFHCFSFIGHIGTRVYRERKLRERDHKLLEN